MLVVVGAALAVLCIGVPAVFMMIALFMASERRTETPANVYHVNIDARSYADHRAVTVQPAAPAPVYWYPQVDAGERPELGAGAPSRILELDAGEVVYMPRLHRRDLPAGEVQNARIR